MEKKIDVNPVLMRIIHKLLGSKLIFILQIRQTFFQLHFLPVNVMDIGTEPWGSWKEEKRPPDLGAEAGGKRGTLKTSVTYSEVEMDGRRETLRNFLWNAAQRESGKIMKDPERDIEIYTQGTWGTFGGSWSHKS